MTQLVRKEQVKLLDLTLANTSEQPDQDRNRPGMHGQRSTAVWAGEQSYPE
jgi:hypothetical protein